MGHRFTNNEEMTLTYDPFQLESGLLGNTDILVTDAIFTNRLDAFKPEQLELHLTVQADDGEQVIYLGCGDGWLTEDGGKTAIREDGKDRNFHQNSKIGEMFRGLVRVMGDNPDANKVMRARAEEFPLGPRAAGFWNGLNLHVAREERKGSGDISDYEVLVVDGFNGAEGGTKAAGATKKVAKKAAAAKGKAKDEAAGGLTDAIRAKLDEIADASGTHDEFMEKALADVPEASTDVEVKAAVADDTSADGIWQQAIARYQASQG